MSLVGTRPPTVDEWDKYELHHRARLATKPGLTGMWQVSGRSNITDLIKQFDDLNLICPCTDVSKLDIALETVKRTKYKEYESNTETIIESIEQFIKRNFNNE